MRRTLASLATVLLLAVGCSTYEQDVTTWARGQAGLSGSSGYEATGGWMDTLVGARVQGSDLYITLQVDRSDKAPAVRAEKFYLYTLRLTSDQPDWTDDVKWVIVEDGAGTVITQGSV